MSNDLSFLTELMDELKPLADQLRRVDWRKVSLEAGIKKEEALRALRVLDELESKRTSLLLRSHQTA